MPRYTYKCKCENEFDLYCKMTDYSPTVRCDKCGEMAKRKVDDLVCGLSIDNTNSFYRKTN